MKLFNEFKEVNNNLKEYKSWEQQQSNIEKRRELLSQTSPVSTEDLKYADSYGRTVIDAVNLLDDHIEAKEVGVDTFISQITEKSGTIGSVFGILTALPILGKIKHKNLNLKKYAVPVVITSSVLGKILGTAVGTIWGINTHKDASIIAKYEAMDDCLKDKRRFVVYSPEQIKKAEEIAKKINLPNEKYQEFINPVSGISGCIEAVKTTIANKKELKNKENQHHEEEVREQKLHNLQISTEQMSDAEKSQSILFRVMKKIDHTSQEYGENVALGLHIGVLSSVLLSYSGGKIIEKLTSALQKSGKLSSSSGFINGFKKYLSPILAFSAGIISSFYSLSLQNEATSVGRFIAKKELTKNPYNFIFYPKEQLNNIEVKEKKKKSDNSTIGEKIKNILQNTLSDIKALYNYKKDLKEYKEYKNSGELHDRKVREAFKQLDVSKEQLQDASILQKRVFKTFDQMMESKHEHVEKIEATSEIFKSILLAAFSIPTISICSKELMELPEVEKLKSIKNINKNLIKTVAKTALEMGGEITLALILPLSIYELISTKITKIAAKISSMEALQNLNDPKNYVDYTELQTYSAESEVKKEMQHHQIIESKPDLYTNMTEFKKSVTTP